MQSLLSGESSQLPHEKHQLKASYRCDSLWAGTMPPGKHIKSILSIEAFTRPPFSWRLLLGLGSSQEAALWTFFWGTETWLPWPWHNSVVLVNLSASLRRRVEFLYVSFFFFQSFFYVLQAWNSSSFLPFLPFFPLMFFMLRVMENGPMNINPLLCQLLAAIKRYQHHGWILHGTSTIWPCPLRVDAWLRGHGAGNLEAGTWLAMGRFEIECGLAEILKGFVFREVTG